MISMELLYITSPTVIFITSTGSSREEDMKISQRNR